MLVEKPIDITLSRVDDIIAATQQAGVVLACVFPLRFVAGAHKAREALAGGRLGRLTLADVFVKWHRPQSYYDQSWRGTWALDGGGVLMNQGIHLVDLLVWYLGDPVAVQASAATLQRAIEVEDTAVASLRFASGALATVSATTTAAPGFPHRLELYGTGGAIQIEGEAVIRWQLVEPARAKVEPVPPGEARGAGPGADPRAISPSGR